MRLLAFFLAVAWEQHGKEIVLAGAAIGVLTAGVRQMWKYGKRVVAFFVRVEKSLNAVETQLMTNNGGSTVLDKIDNINERTAALEEWRKKQEGEA